MIHSTRATPALRALVEADPALAALALWCAHRDGSARTETAGDTIHYGEDFARLALHEQMGLASHHILHVALRHPSRMACAAERMGAAFAPDLWGICADAIVNEALLLAGHALPRPALRLAELLGATIGAPLSPRSALADWDADRLYLALLNAGQGDATRSHAASRGFAPDLQPDDAGHPKQTTALDEGAWRQHLSRAMEAGRLAGQGIGMLAAVLADIAAPRTPWEVVLRGLLARALLPLPRESFLRPARGWLAMEAEAHASGRPMPGVLPGRLRGMAVPRIAVGLDTSSSIGAEQARLFLSEVAGIARRSGGEVHVIPFDEEPEPAVRLDPLAPALPARPMRKGGGTDFRPALVAAVALGPSAIVMLTDLDGPAGLPPGVPVIWATTGPATVPFGRHLDLSA